jgi:hypothetical protein
MTNRERKSSMKIATILSRHLVAAAMGLLACVAIGNADELETETPAALRPYNVRVFVAIDDNVEFQPEFRARVLADLRDRCDGYWGRMCNTAIEEFPQLLPATAATLGRLAITHESPEVANCDKAFFLTLQVDGGGYLVAGKCWDATARNTSDVITAQVFRRGDIADRLFGLLSDLFEPIVEIADFDAERVTLQIRAGEILPPDPSQAQLKPGRLLTPFYRFLSKEGEVRRIQEIPWTYLIVSDVDRATATCKIVSGLRVPLTTRRRRLIEALAQGVRPKYDSTRLTFVSQQFADQPIFGVTVSIVPEKAKQPTGEEQAKDETPEPVSLMTDRAGTVTITGDGSNMPIMLAVHSGKSALARVPLLPGLEAETQVRLPDDTVRLNVEGQLAVLEAEVIDAVAKRAVLMARTRSAIRENDWKSVDEFLKRMDEISGPSRLQTELTIIRERGVNAALARKDTSAQRRIERLCSQTGELIETYLNLDKVRQFREETAELRKALDAK